MKKILLIVIGFVAFQLQGQNRIESSLEEFLDNGTWQNSAGANYTYDTNGNLLTDTKYSFTSTAWIASYRTTYIYNANNRATSSTDQNWDFLTSQWVNSFKTIYTYDGTGKLITILNQDWISGAWVNLYKNDIVYVGNLISTVANPKWENNSWVNEFRYTATYTGNNIIQWFGEKWTGSAWINDSRNIFSYNASNKKTGDRLDVWQNNVWSEDENKTYVLAANGNRTSEIFSVEGILNNKFDYTYDAAALMSSFVTPFKDKTGVDYLFSDFPYVNKILSSMNYDYNVTTSSYNLSSRTTYNYNNQLVLNTPNLEIKTVKIYPNPATNFITIEGLLIAEKITIYNLLGKKVFEQTVNASDKINIQNLSTGLYLLNFENGSSLKFIKE